MTAVWTWLRRAGQWVALALACLIPGALWLSERRRRLELEQALADETARSQRQAELADRTEEIRQAHAEEVRDIAVATEAAVAPHEAAAAEVRAIDTEDPGVLVDLASRLDRTFRPRAK